MPRWHCMVYGCMNPATYRSKSGFLYCNDHAKKIQDLLIRGEHQEKKNRWPRPITPVERKGWNA